MNKGVLGIAITLKSMLYDSTMDDVEVPEIGARLHGEFCHAPYKVRCVMHPIGVATLIFCLHLLNVGK